MVPLAQLSSPSFGFLWLSVALASCWFLWPSFGLCSCGFPLLWPPPGSSGLALAAVPVASAQLLFGAAHGFCLFGCLFVLFHNYAPRHPFILFKFPHK